MSISNFLKLVEIQTKLASLFPFLVGVLFSMSYFGQIHWLYTVLFFIGMLIFDMTTTAINNYMDYQKAKDDEYKREVNIIGEAKIKPQLVATLIWIMLALASIIGFYLSYQTGWVLFVIGGLSCLIGIFYTFGPVPLSRMPLGEVFSGVTMGFGIFLITIYINAFDLNFLNLQIIDWQFFMVGNLKALLAIFWASLPLVFTIANIMLANNLCDLDQDIKNHRYTLPYYIGREAGLKLFNFLMYSCYIVVILGTVFGVYQWPALITLVTFPMIQKNVQAFNAKQIKSETFVIAIKNLILFNSALIVGMLIGLILS